MNPPAETAVIYSAVLRPHRSAGQRAALIVVGVVAAQVIVISTGFLFAGAWPVMPFFGLEIVLLYLLLRFNQRAGNAFEAINLTRQALTVRRVDHWGKQSDFSFPPDWLQVNLQPLPGHDNFLELRTHGCSLAIASFLPAHEREELAVILRRALGRLRTNLPAE